jgi:hypothetical protein
MSTLVSHSPEGSITSLLLRAATKAALLEAVCVPSPWHPEFKALLQVITKRLTSSVMCFMADNYIDLHHNIRMDGYLQQDSFLMANFIKQGASSPELTSMIQLRNFLRFSRMSEVVTGCGSRILASVYNGGGQRAMQPISGQSSQDHQKVHGRYGRSTWGL